MKNAFFAIAIMLLGFNAQADYEAGTPRAERVASEASVKALAKALGKQAVYAEGHCSLEVLRSNVSGDKVLVNFFQENHISKFGVGVICQGSEEVGEVRYEIQGRLGDGAILIESVLTKEQE